MNIGPYTLMGEVGRGNMGIVYKAMDPSQGRTVAIKMVQGFAALNQQGRMGLVREARATGSLNHPNIVKIYDIGQHRGWLYIVMEYLHGRSLERMIRSQSVLSVGQKLQILIQICYALDHAHCKGVIHRDVKPPNVFVVRDGTVKVVDFGLAIQKHVSHGADFAGTIPYMSPEQLTGGRVDSRSDIWSAGVTMYELLSGTRPFQGTTLSDIQHRILTARAPVLGASVPLAGEFDHVLGRALEKNRDLRYPTARAFATELCTLEHALHMSLLSTQEPSKESVVAIEPQAQQEQQIANQSEEIPAEHYSQLDLGFHCYAAGSVSIRVGEFGLRKLRYRLENIWHSVKWLIPPTFYALPLWLLLRALLFVVQAADSLVRYPRCSGCGITMSLTSSWTRSVKSNSEVTFGYRDCIAALQERMWPDAAKLFLLHGGEPTEIRSNKLISTPLRNHLEFYECGICSHHAARLTTDDLIDDDWSPRVEFTEARHGVVAKTPPMLTRLRLAMSRMSDVVVASFRRTDLIRINIRVVCTIVVLFMVFAAVIIQGRRAERVREDSGIRVWADSWDMAYYCPGSRWYGVWIHNSRYMSENEALQQGYHSAVRRIPSSSSSACRKASTSVPRVSNSH